MSKITTLILDAGGVLVHPIHGNWNIPVKYRELLGDYAADIPGERWLQACRDHAQIIREDVFVSDMDAEFLLRKEFFIRIAADLGWQLDENTIEALCRDFTYNISRYAWYDDAADFLPRFHAKYRMGMLSDAMPSFRHVMDNHPARAHFDALVISTEIGAAKPDARMYNEICARLGVSPEECLFVDDRECNLTGAMNCGIHAVQMCRDGLPQWDGPAVHDLAELNAYLEGLN